MKNESNWNWSKSLTFSAAKPRMAVRDWPGCVYILPLPPKTNYAIAAEWIWAIFPAMWILLGTTGNFLSSVVIFRRYRKLSSTALFLLILALTDTVFLLNEPLKHLLYTIADIDVRSSGKYACKILQFLTFATFHLSAWILVLVTLERVICITWPHKVKIFATEKNAARIITSIVVLVFVINSHELYGFDVVIYGTNTTLTSKACAATPGSYATFYVHQWFCIHFVFGYLTPFLCIVIGNVIVLRGLRQMNRARKSLQEKTDFLTKTDQSKSRTQRGQTLLRDDQVKDTKQLKPVKITMDQSNGRYQSQHPIKYTDSNGTQEMNQSRDTTQNEQPIKNVKSPHKSSKRQARTNRSLTMMLLLLNTIFFISQTPLAVLLVYIPYEEDKVNSFACSDMIQYMAGAERLYFWAAVTHNFAYMNASINFILYVISGTEFRKQLIFLMKCSSKTVEIHSRSQSSM